MDSELKRFTEWSDPRVTSNGDFGAFVVVDKKYIIHLSISKDLLLHNYDDPKNILHPLELVHIGLTIDNTYLVDESITFMVEGYRFKWSPLGFERL